MPVMVISVTAVDLNQINCRREVMSSIMKQKNDGQAGFTLIECLSAMVILMVGALGAAVLIINGINMQKHARNITAANAFAKDKVEHLRSLLPTSAASTGRPPGGNADADVANYNDLNSEPGGATPRFKRRWLVESSATPGVPANTHRVTIRVTSNKPDVLLPTIQMQALLTAN